MTAYIPQTDADRETARLLSSRAKAMAGDTLRAIHPNGVALACGEAPARFYAADALAVRARRSSWASLVAVASSRRRARAEIVAVETAARRARARAHP